MTLKRINEPNKKNNIYTLRVDGETHALILKALQKINSTIEMSLTTFERLALKSFANKILASEDIGIVFK